MRANGSSSSANDGAATASSGSRGGGKKVSVKAVEPDDDPVVAEMDCYALPINRSDLAVATLQFSTEKPSELENCTARIKPIVKHLEIDYSEGAHRSDGARDSGATFAGKATSDSEVVNHALCFVEDHKAYFLEVDDTYRMRRKIGAGADGATEPIEEDAPKSRLSPIRVKFARAETEAQRKRREQSSFFKHQQAELESWKPLDVIHETPAYALKLPTPAIDDDGIPVVAAEAAVNGAGLRQPKVEQID